MQGFQEFLAGLGSGDWITLGLFIVSVFFGFLSWISRTALGRVRRERDEARQLQQLERNQMRSAVLAELLTWARMSNEAMSEANVLFRNKPQGQAIDPKAAGDLMARLSALVDTGRLDFPNHSGDLDWPRSAIVRAR